MTSSSRRRRCPPGRGLRRVLGTQLLSCSALVLSAPLALFARARARAERGASVVIAGITSMIASCGACCELGQGRQGPAGEGAAFLLRCSPKWGSRERGICVRLDPRSRSSATRSRPDSTCRLDSWLLTSARLELSSDRCECNAMVHGPVQVRTVRGSRCGLTPGTHSPLHVHVCMKVADSVAPESFAACRAPKSAGGPIAYNKGRSEIWTFLYKAGATAKRG